MTDPGHDRCERCLFQRRVCLCAEIPRIANRTEVVIVRHHLERYRSSNSGRLAALALERCRVIDHGGDCGSAVLPPLDGAWLVYPQGEAVVPAVPPAQLVFLDATWSQARRMYRKLDGLRGLPILRLAIDASTPRLRESPQAGFGSTIEAIAAALRMFDGDLVAEPLLRLFHQAVSRAEMTGRMVNDPGRVR
jgi:DTW domain-containing protein YfiP